MSLHVVVGAGPVGRHTARLLAAEGHQVRIVNRSGAGAPSATVESIALDARDAAGLAKVSAGAEAIFMCAMAPYTDWPEAFPPIMEGVASAAETVGAKLLVLGNVYGYGEDGPSLLTPSTPLAPTTRKGATRVQMWRRALTAKVPTLEVRASDYLGAGAGSLFTLMTLPALLAGQPALHVGDLDALHPWAFTRDVARTLVAAASYEGEWGRAFHAPSQYASIRALAHRFAAAAGAPPPVVRSLGGEDLAQAGEADPLMREVAEIAYLYARPLIVDASETEAGLGVFASDLELIISDTLGGEP